MLACLLVLLTGCSTAVHRGGNERPPDWGIAENVKPPLVAPVVPAPPPTPAPTLPAPPAPPEEPVNTWVSLDRWSQQHGFGAVRRLSRAPTVTYALSTTNGLLVVTIGSRSASWDGVELRLGFTPQQIDGQVFLHGLDLRKNLEPLLGGFRLNSWTNRVIVIDPGHGGANMGAKNIFNGRDEKEYTLDWARRLEPLLATNGWKVFLTRTRDVEVSPTNRVNFADQHHADLFLSLHFNSLAPAKEPAGLETYCVTPTGMPSSLTRGYEDDPSRIFPNNAFDGQNLQFAVRLHRALLAVNGNQDRGVGRARFITVLREQNRPAVLVEGGYLSNPHEARRIADPAYRQKLAEAVAKALND
jgi:N-acetylmuramoyl-L-alanine amidase